MDKAPIAGNLSDPRAVIQTSFVPVVLVLCTPAAEKLCQTACNNTRFIDVLRSVLYQSPARRASVRLGEGTHEISDLKVRFMDITQLERPVDDAAALGNKVDESLPGDTFADIKIRTKADVPLFQRAYKDSTPWFDRYKVEFIRGVGSSEHEYFSHPVAVVIAAAADEANHIASLVKLYDPARPPVIFQEGRGDVTAPKLYALLQEGDVVPPAVEKKLVEMKNTFGNTSCTVVKLGDQKIDDRADGPKTVPRFVTDLVYRSVIPYVEKSISDLNEFVSASKKGSLQKMRNFFRLGAGGSGKTKEEEAPGNYIYGGSSVETATRRLADLLFMIQDYEAALANYRACAKDFNNEKTWHYFAGTQEMIGLCLFLLGRDVENFLDVANSTYQKSGRDRFAMRSTFFYGDILKLRGNFKTASDVYSRAAERDTDPFCSAILQEQAAFCYLFMSPPMFRKFSFRLIMAGLRFADINKRKHALRCYMWAYSVYEGKSWAAVDDHLHLSLVRHSYSLSRMNDALHYIQKLLAKNIQSFQKQNSIVREFLYICKAAGAVGGEAFPPIPIPVINNNAVRVYLNDYTPQGSDIIWNEMEDAFRLEDAVHNKGPARQGFDLWKAKEDTQLKTKISVVEEVIYVEVEIKNPLSVPLQFTHMHLTATLEPPTTPAAAPSSPTPFSPPPAHDPASSSPADPSSPAPVHSPRHDQCDWPASSEVSMAHAEPQATEGETAAVVQALLDELVARRGVQGFRVFPVDVLLGPQEVKRLRLALQPLKEGVLTIQGIAMCMCGSVWGRREFTLKQRRLNKTPQQRQTPTYEPNLTLTIKIAPPMPRLEVAFQDMPRYIYNGEVRRAGLTLHNCSTKTGLRNVRVRLSHSTFVTIGEDEKGSSHDAPLTSSGTSSMSSSSSGASSSLIPAIPVNVSVGPNETLTVPLWVIGGAVGSFTFCFLFYYESELPNREVRYRLTRCQAEVKVLPSIRVSAFTQQSATDLHAYVLGLDVENKDPNMAFGVKQVSCVSTVWRIDPLCQMQQGGLTVAGKQSFNSFFRISRAPTTEDSGASTTDTTKKAVSRHVGNKVHTDVLLDTAKQGVDSAEHPQLTFLRKEHALQRRIQAQQAHAHAHPHKDDRTTRPGAPPQDHTSAEMDDHINKLDLIVFWEGSKQLGGPPTIFGQHNVPLVSFMPMHNKDPLLASPWGTMPRGNHLLAGRMRNDLVPVPLRFDIDSPAQVAHRFQSGSICVVPIKLHVANCSSYTSLTFDFTTLMPHELADPEHGRAMYAWAGTSAYLDISLAPQAQTSLDLSVCFFQPGVFNLNRFKFTVRAPDQPNQDVFSPFQHLISVEDGEVRE